ncbi:MAG: methyl-accepting chemotaxis protein [Neomegalonema sp.]|nr:methyl-accepting chemotaxis protein [Neomegalonema sp.]
MAKETALRASREDITIDEIDVIQALVDGNLSVDPPRNGPLSKPLQALTRRLRQDALAELDSGVELSMRMNEASIIGARLTKTMRDTSGFTQEIAAAAEELSASVSTIGAAIESTVEHAAELKSSADQGLEGASAVTAEFEHIQSNVGEASAIVSQLVKTARQISKITSLISEIAMKTNMLAVNASIEAVRAGAAGRGFAIVADEVQTLAQQTEKATSNIGASIDTLVEQVNTLENNIGAAQKSTAAGGVVVARMREISDEAARRSTEVDGQMQTISSMLGEQQLAAGDVAKNAGTISDNVAAVDGNLSDLSDAVDSAVAAVAGRLREIEKVELPGKVLRLAKADHVIWKKRLADIFAGKETISEEELSSHRSCRLGKWYFGPEARQFAGSRAFKALDKPHQAVHENGIAAVKAFNAGDIARALQFVDLVETASQDVIDGLDQLIAES